MFGRTYLCEHPFVPCSAEPTRVNSDLDEHKQNHEPITTDTHPSVISTRLKPVLRQQPQVSIPGNNSMRIAQYINLG